jgi:hypothetical protein
MAHDNVLVSITEIAFYQFFFLIYRIHAVLTMRKNLHFDGNDVCGPSCVQIFTIQQTHMRAWNGAHSQFSIGHAIMLQNISQTPHLLTKRKKSVRGWKSLSWSRNSLAFMKGSLLHSQGPTIPICISQLNLISYFFKIHFNAILPSMSMSPKWSLFSRFPNTNFG